MASVLTGFEYDIFISYRQKDNKYDGWVTEFVQNLKKELEATFKEDVSIYFDENPYDGLLETHDVGDSLRNKLACLIFIPIISQTYCDPKCFAWNNEFMPFKILASEDQFGLKVKLSNGNVASRILPVRIHELDADDSRTIEDALGGALRAIEFIYKEPGVNRPLRPTDTRAENQLKTDYRNQVNKVANSIKEIITGMKSGGNEATPASVGDKLKYSQSKYVFSKAKLYLSIILSAIVILVVGYFVFHNSQNADQEKRIAVLAFADMSPNKDQEHFADGLSEELINMLVRVPNLKVTARTSAFAFKGKDEDIRTIARKLNVGYVLEGSVRKSVDRIKITAQLIDALTGDHLWSETIERDNGDILKLQDEIANAVVKTLRVSLLHEIDYGDRQTNQDALNMYLQGRYNNMHHHVEKSIQNYLAAIKIDSLYTKAWAGLAWSYSIISPNDSLSAAEILQKRKVYAQKAYSLNPNDPEAIRSMIQQYQGDYNKMQEMANRGLALEPNNVDILIFASIPLVYEHRFDEAIELIKRAIDIDPLNYLPHSILSSLYLNEGRLEEYKEALQTSFELGKDVPGMVYAMSEMSLIDGDIQRSLEYLSKIDYAENPWAKILSFVPLYLDGREREAKEILKWAEAEQADYFPLEIAVCYFYKNDFDHTFQYLDKAIDLKNMDVRYIREDEYFGKDFRSDPRYKVLLSKLNLSDKEIKWSLYDHLKKTGKYKLK